MQFSGSAWPAETIKSSGVQRPALVPLPHVASCEACPEGTKALGKQCAPAQAVSQAGRMLASITGGPVHGHVNVTGGRVGASQPIEQAPVGAVGVLDVGS
jgi:hypothetical protein